MENLSYKETKIPKLEDVRSFWEANPLHSHISRQPEESADFFEDQQRFAREVIFAGKIDPRIFPDQNHQNNVLDLGCGPGLWTAELAFHGVKNIVAADLTKAGLELTKKRCQFYNIEVNCQQENAENLTFKDETFSHVQCFGVIHHTPDTPACVREIARVLRPGGSAAISVYYKNLILKNWPFLKYGAKLLSSLGAQLEGRGRENIYNLDNIDEIVRHYDGAENPIGKYYSKQQFAEMLSPYFEIEDLFLHYFPVQSLPFKIPFWLHRFLELNLGFMIVAKVKKK